MKNQGPPLKTLALETLFAGQFTLSTQLIKQNYFKIPSTDSTPQFFVESYHLYSFRFYLQVRYAEDLGVPKSKGAWLVGFLSITSTLGRVVFGKISDLKFVNRLYLYQFSIFCIGVTTLLCPLVKNYAGLVGYALIFGFFDGCFVGQVAVITADVVGRDKLSQAVGNMFGTMAIPLSLGPPLAGNQLCKRW